MPYIIALVIIVVAAGALLLFREPAEAPAMPVTDEAATEEQVDVTIEGAPEGFTPPTTPPPTTQNDMDLETELDTEVEAVAPISQTFVAEASYFTPRRTEHEMLITLELQGETIIDANVTYDGGTAQTPNHSAFDNAYKAEVIGQNINNVQLSRVGGASLTSTAFNEAIADIRAQI